MQMKHGRDVLANDDAQPKKGEFYILRPDMRGGGRGHGVIFENEKALLTPPSICLRRDDISGFPPLKETPRLRFDKRKGGLPDDLDADFSGYWLVSEILKQVFESVDPDGFAFAACEFILEDGSKGPPHYLCDVMRTIDAVDVSASTLRVKTGENYPNGKYYSLTGGARLAFKKELVVSTHAFRTPYTADVFCDRKLRDALRDNGFGKPPSTRGVWLQDAADY